MMEAVGADIILNDALGYNIQILEKNFCCHENILHIGSFPTLDEHGRITKPFLVSSKHSKKFKQISQIKTSISHIEYLQD